MTLTEVLPVVWQLPVFEKLQLIRILAAEVDINEDISPLKPHHVYYLPTPYNMFGASRVLMDTMSHLEIYTNSETTNLH